MVRSKGGVTPTCFVFSITVGVSALIGFLLIMISVVGPNKDMEPGVYSGPMEDLSERVRAALIMRFLSRGHIAFSSSISSINRASLPASHICLYRNLKYLAFAFSLSPSLSAMA